MEVENMKGFLKARYNHERKWCYRVDHMSDEQVIAIYYRLVRAHDLERQKAQPLYQCKAHNPIYQCEACGETYTRDNPELEECEFCGNQNIRRLLSNGNH